jgi:hypothetical protein
VFEVLCEHPWVTTTCFAEITGRDHSATKSAFLRLFKAGLLARQELYEDGVYRGYVYSAAPRGRRIAVERDWPHERLVVTPKKSALLVPHELEITNFNRLLVSGAEAGGFERPIFERRRKYLKFSWHAEQERFVVNNDELIVLARRNSDLQAFFLLEVEKGRQHGYDDGESSRMRKARSLVAYRDSKAYVEHWAQWGMDVRGVRSLWIMETPRQRDNFLRRLRLASLGYRLFSVCAEEDYRRDVYGLIWRTPHGWQEGETDSGPRHSFADLCS